jgi:hypothetical protein
MSPRRRDDLVRRVDNAAIPSTESAPKGFYVAIVGTPSDGDTAVYDAGLGYFVPAAGGGGIPSFAWIYMTTIDETGATVFMTDSDGSYILTYAPVP